MIPRMMSPARTMILAKLFERDMSALICQIVARDRSPASWWKAWEDSRCPELDFSEDLDSEHVKCETSDDVDSDPSADWYGVSPVLNDDSSGSDVVRSDDQILEQVVPSECETHTRVVEPCSVSSESFLVSC